MDVLVIDDDRNIRTTLGMCLEALGCRVAQAAEPRAALAALDRASRDLAFLDLKLGKANGLELLPALLGRCRRVVLMSAYLDVSAAVEAMRGGAWEILPKPFTPEAVRALVARVQPDAEGTRSPRLRQILQTVERVARHEVPLLFVGEAGSGTSELAHLAYQRSGRSPLTELHGPSEPPHREFAPGTLLIEEVGGLHPSLQRRLHKLLGDPRSGTRVIATSQRELRNDPQFRQDLLFHLNTVELRVPALRERKEDLLPLARHFVAPKELAPEAERMLLAYDWPGNLDELKSVMERAAVLAPGSVITPESLALSGDGARAAHVGGDFSIEEVERAHILAVVERHRRLDQAAEVLGIDTSTLWRKRKKIN
jgi:NtrC-family two-component system response regulator AlgB